MPDRTETAAENNFDRRIIDVVIRLGFLGLLAYWVGLIIGPFVVIVIWAGILTAAILPLYAWLKDKLGGRGGLSSTIITLVALGIILGPAGFLAANVLENVQSFASKLQDGTLHVPPPDESVRDWPMGGQIYSAWQEASTNLTAFLKQHSDGLIALSKRFLSTAAGVGGGVISFAVSVIIAAFLYGRGAAIADSLGGFAERIIADRGREFVAMSGATIRNVARGVIGVSLIQAVLAGIGLILAGIPAAGVLTLLILLLGILQAPPTLIIVPAIIYAWSSLDFATALIFTIYMVPVALLDNFLKPILMAKGLKTPMLVIFIGVIGGTLAHGLIGLFLGPIVLAVFYELLVAWVTGDVPAPDTGGEPDAAATDGAETA